VRASFDFAAHFGSLLSSQSVSFHISCMLFAASQAAFHSVVKSAAALSIAEPPTHIAFNHFLSNGELRVFAKSSKLDFTCATVFLVPVNPPNSIFGTLIFSHQKISAVRFLNLAPMFAREDITKVSRFLKMLPKLLIKSLPKAIPIFVISTNANWNALNTILTTSIAKIEKSANADNTGRSHTTILFHNLENFSPVVSASCAVAANAHCEFNSMSFSCCIFSLPVWTAATNSVAILSPNNSVAILVHSIGSFAFFILSNKSVITVIGSLPSDANCVNALFNPLITASVFTQLVCSCDSNATLSVKLNHKFCNCVPELISDCDNDSNDTHVSWVALSKTSNTSQDLDCSILNSCSISETSPIALLVSPRKSIKSKNAGATSSICAFDSSLNLVASIPTASDTCPMLSSTFGRTLSTTSCKSLRSCPVAPVSVASFFVALSIELTNLMIASKLNDAANAAHIPANAHVMVLLTLQNNSLSLLVVAAQVFSRFLNSLLLSVNPACKFFKSNCKANGVSPAFFASAICFLIISILLSACNISICSFLCSSLSIFFQVSRAKSSDFVAEFLSMSISIT